MYSAGLKLLHFLEPELAHYIAINFLKFSRRKKFRFESDRLKTEVAGLNLYHPLGLSGGFDKNGEIASTGQINMDIINQFIEHDIYSPKNRHSYDRNDFDFNFIKGLIFEDAVATLNYFTALIISNYFEDNFTNCSNIILCGGGRKNKTLIQNLKSLLKKNICDIDKFNYDGDFIESQAFAYLAIRNILQEPISFPDTTGCLSPTTGGVLIKIK